MSTLRDTGPYKGRGGGGGSEGGGAQRSGDGGAEGRAAVARGDLVNATLGKGGDDRARGNRGRDR